MLVGIGLLIVVEDQITPHVHQPGPRPTLLNNHCIRCHLAQAVIVQGTSTTFTSLLAGAFFFSFLLQLLPLLPCHGLTISLYPIHHFITEDLFRCRANASIVTKVTII